MRTSDLLKFGTHIGGLKANTIINFGMNLFNIQGIISDFTHKAKLNFCLLDESIWQCDLELAHADQLLQ